jgi:Fe2+ transport system protein FeoA
MPRSTLLAMVRNHAVAIGIESMARAVFGPLLVDVGATRLALGVETD